MIILDFTEIKMAIFIDKNKKYQCIDLHSVNKCKNKKFLKRYDYYKKFFYEKLEERFARRQKELEENKNIILDSEKKELNKTL